jgi:ribosomal-protein-alanine N-acetyltransferase
MASIPNPGLAGRQDSQEPVEIREMAEKDLDEVLEIERAAFPSPWSRGLFERELATPFARSFVARRKGAPEVVGYMCFWLVDTECHLLNLAVHPRHRGRGIGAEILGYGVAYCLREGVQLITLEVRRSNYRAISLYRNFHFQPQGVRRRYYTDSGEDAIVMGLDLGNSRFSPSL